MKLIHLSDLHLGKHVNAFSLLEDQEYILKRILQILDEEKPDALIIAGDIYDKPIPPAEAIRVFDDFLYALARRSLPAFIICGNHDSPERIAFASRLLGNSGVYLSPVYSGQILPIPLTDAFGPVDFYLLPFLKPAMVRRFFPNEDITSYSDAVSSALRPLILDPSRRNVLIAHQFFAGAEQCASEEISVGGSEAVDRAVTDSFDYVALGHLHGPQSVGRPEVRYSGSPLMYSFSEIHHKKSLTVIELGEKGQVAVSTRELIPLRAMREIRGSYMELTARTFYEGTNTEDYLRVILTDENDIPDAIRRLRTIYPNIMSLEYDNTRTRTRLLIEPVIEAELRSPIELFDDFYRKQNGAGFDEQQRAYLDHLVDTIWRT